MPSVRRSVEAAVSGAARAGPSGVASVAGKRRPEAEPAPRAPARPRADGGGSGPGLRPRNAKPAVGEGLVSRARRSFRGSGHVPLWDRPGFVKRRSEGVAVAIPEWPPRGWKTGFLVGRVFDPGASALGGRLAFKAFRHPWCGDDGFRGRGPSEADRGRSPPWLFSVQGTPTEREVGSRMALRCARSLAGSMRRQERRSGGALCGLPRTRIPDASFLKRALLGRFNNIL